MSSRRTKVLIIEDDAFLSGMYAEKLHLEGYDVHTAMDGEEGVRQAAAVKPDLVLLDVLLPKMDGFEVLRHLRGAEATAKVPVIMLTNLSQPEDVQRGLTLGANDYLVKAHFVPTEVVEKIRALVP